MLSFLCYTWQFTPGLLSGKSHGQRSLVGYSPWGRKESDKTERLHSLTHVHMGPPRWCSGKEPAWQYRRHRRHGFDSWVWKISLSRKWQPTLVFLPQKLTEAAWWATVHRVAKSQTQLSTCTHTCAHAHTHTHTYTPCFLHFSEQFLLLSKHSHRSTLSFMSCYKNSHVPTIFIKYLFDNHALTDHSTSTVSEEIVL